VRIWTKGARILKQTIRCLSETTDIRTKHTTGKKRLFN